MVLAYSLDFAAVEPAFFTVISSFEDVS